jgi:hypothetical protein
MHKLNNCTTKRDFRLENSVPHDVKKSKRQICVTLIKGGFRVCVDFGQCSLRDPSNEKYSGVYVYTLYY